MSPIRVVRSAPSIHARRWLAHLAVIDGSGSPPALLWPRRERLAPPPAMSLQHAEPAAERAAQIATGGWLRTTREDLGLSQSELARRTRVPQTTISRLERGQRMGVEEYLVLCAGMKVNPFDCLAEIRDLIDGMH